MSLSRFLLLFRKQLAEYGRLYGLGLAALAGLWLILLVLVVYQNGGGSESQYLLLSIGLLLGGVVFTQHLFQPLANPSDAIRYLHLPASTLEKIAVALFYSLFVFMPAVILVFYAVDYPMVMLARPRFAGKVNLLGPLQVLPPSQLKSLIQIYVITTAFMAFGSVYFRRYAIVKTLVVAIAFIIGMQMLNQAILSAVMDIQTGTRVSGEVFGRAILMDGTPPNEMVELPQSWKDAFENLFLYGLPVFCWFLTWVRLRETEV